MKIAYQQAIERLNLLDNLQSFDPIVIGTPPLGIAVEDSDIDIACSSPDLNRFKNSAIKNFGSFNNFQVQDSRQQNLDSVVVQFTALNWDIEIFCQTIPTSQQRGVRHFHVEQRLLALSPLLMKKTLELKRDGLKTEPAFARALGLPGDPYEAILKLENKDDQELALLVAKV